MPTGVVLSGDRRRPRVPGPPAPRRPSALLDSPLSTSAFEPNARRPRTELPALGRPDSGAGQTKPSGAGRKTNSERRPQAKTAEGRGPKGVGKSANISIPAPASGRLGRVPRSMPPAAGSSRKLAVLSKRKPSLWPSSSSSSGSGSSRGSSSDDDTALLPAHRRILSDSGEEALAAADMLLSTGFHGSQAGQRPPELQPAIDSPREEAALTAAISAASESWETWDPFSPAAVQEPELLEAMQGCVGLRNLGNTCFLNSVLQCLNGVPEFVAAVLGHRQASDHAADEDRGTGVLPALAALLQAAWEATPGEVLVPSRLLACLARFDERWAEAGQQDAQELLHALLGCLRLDMAAGQGRLLEARRSSLELSETQQAADAWRREQAVHTAAVDATFGGLLQSTVVCGGCGGCSHSHEYFLDLSLPLPGARGATLEDCLELFTAPEALPADEGYRCPRCKRRQAATKQLRLARLPPVLILHLKRFAATPGLLTRAASLSKDSSAVQLRADGLDLSSFCCSAPASGARPVYDLVTVCHHSGSLIGGHYTATCRLAQDAWLHCNDEQVSTGGSPELCSRSAYLLFYRRRE